jgi:peroxiredoxin
MADLSLRAELEAAFARARALDLSLADRLHHVAREVRRLSPMFADQVDRFVERLSLAEAGHAAPQVGEKLPNFILPDEQGRLVRLADLLATSPLVVAFHRGHWCPYCRLAVSALADAEARLLPARVVAISAETQGYSARLKAEAGAGFPMLTDFAAGYALSLGLAVVVDDQMAGLIGSAGWDVPRYQGFDGWVLPIPAAFVVDQAGVIVARHVDPDYRRRMAIEAMADAIARLG